MKYALYPRLQDLPKFLFFAVGYWFGFSLHGLDTVYGPASWDAAFPGLCFTFLVLEYLAYQARYQINDIRGREEDAQNPARKARHRLLNMFGDSALSIKLSALVAGYRLLVVGVLIAASWGGSGPVYLVYIAICPYVDEQSIRIAHLRQGRTARQEEKLDSIDEYYGIVLKLLDYQAS